MTKTNTALRAQNKALLKAEANANGTAANYANLNKFLHLELKTLERDKNHALEVERREVTLLKKSKHELEQQLRKTQKDWDADSRKGQKQARRFRKQLAWWRSHYSHLNPQEPPIQEWDW